MQTFIHAQPTDAHATHVPWQCQHLFVMVVPLELGLRGATNMLLVTKPSILHVGKQPSPLAILPSSHSSPTPTVPSPQMPEFGQGGWACAVHGYAGLIGLLHLPSCMLVSNRPHLQCCHRHMSPQNQLFHHHTSLWEWVVWC